MEERREFFRVEDMAFVQVRPWQEGQNSVPEYFPEMRFLTLKGEFERLQQQCEEMLENIEDEEIRKLTDLQNQKIDLLSRYLLFHDLSVPSAGTPQQIAVSEGGLSCRAALQPEPGDDLAIVFIFTPSYLPFFVKARTVACRPALEGGYIIQCEFYKLAECDRQQLARHLLKQQAEQRRLQRKDR